MMKLHTLALCLGVFIQADGAILHPAFTGRVGFIYLQNNRAPVFFRDIITNVGNMYNSISRTIRIMKEGVYWITFSVQPSKPTDTHTLVLYINGQKSKFYSRADGVPSSKSGALFLRYESILTVFLEDEGWVQKDTLWSVVYVGKEAQAYLGHHSGIYNWLDPVHFGVEITRLSNSLYLDLSTRMFTVLVDSLYLIHLSVVGSRGARFFLEKQDPFISLEWKLILDTRGGRTSKQCSVNAVFNFLRGTKLRVTSFGTPGNGSTISIVSVGAAHDTAAFTGKASRPITLYTSNQAIRFDREYINTKGSYNASMGIFTVPHGGVYIVTFRPDPVPSSLWTQKDNGIMSVTSVCCNPMTFILRNATHKMIHMTTDYYVTVGVSAALYLRTGDKLRVLADTPNATHMGVGWGSLFSITALTLP